MLSRCPKAVYHRTRRLGTACGHHRIAREERSELLGDTDQGLLDRPRLCGTVNGSGRLRW